MASSCTKFRCIESEEIRRWQRWPDYKLCSPLAFRADRPLWAALQSPSESDQFHQPAHHNRAVWLFAAEQPSGSQAGAPRHWWPAHKEFKRKRLRHQSCHQTRSQDGRCQRQSDAQVCASNSVGFIRRRTPCPTRHSNGSGNGSQRADPSGARRSHVHLREGHREAVFITSWIFESQSTADASECRSRRNRRGVQ